MLLTMHTNLSRTSHGPARARGFTLVELMATCTVAGVISAMAVPAFNNIVLTDRDVGQINSLVASFQYARSEAVKRNLRGGITVCPSTDGATCNAGSKWRSGWIVWYTDPLNGPTTLRQMPALGGNTTVTATGNPTGITFLPNGMIQPTVSSTFTVCDARGASFAHEMEVGLAGRIAASTTAGQSVSGATLACR